MPGVLSVNGVSGDFKASRDCNRVLRLSDVTLVAIDTRWPKLALKSLHRSMGQVEFGSIKLFHSGDHPLCDGDIESCIIPPLKSVEDYSRFVLKGLTPYVKTEYVLITQWDSWVVDSNRWADEFLSYDYLGAPWPNCLPHLSVGNGGFSLRSRRALAFGVSTDFEKIHPEDVVLINQHAKLGSTSPIKVAPLDVAKRFSFERPLSNMVSKTIPDVFGFHGLFNIPFFLSESEVYDLLRSLPEITRESKEFSDLVEIHNLEKSRLPWEPVDKPRGIRKFIKNIIRTKH